MFQFPGFAPHSHVVHGLQPCGLPHSDMRGSNPVCKSPRLFAAYHVLPRLRKPRHPPFALVLFFLSHCEEYIGTYVKAAIYHNPWTEKITKERTVNGKTQTYTTYRYHPARYIMLFADGTEDETTVGRYSRLCKKFGTQSYHISVEHSNCVSGGDGTRCDWNGIEEDTEPITKTSYYKNPVRQSNSIFGFRPIPKKRALQMGLCSYPEVDDYQQHVIMVHPDVEQPADIAYADLLLQRINAFVGMKKEVHVFLMLFPASLGLEIADEQRRYWRGLNKNELLICLGVDKDEVKWARGLSWMDAPIMDVKIRDYFIDNPRISLVDFMSWLRPTLEEHWERKHFSDFKYLGNHLTFGRFIANYSVSLFLSVLLFLLFYLGPFSQCQEFSEITIGEKVSINVEPKNPLFFKFIVTQNEIDQGQFLAFSTTPLDYLLPVFIYISKTSNPKPSPDNREFSSQELGQNIVYINKNEIMEQEGEKKFLYICLKSFETASAEFEVSLLKTISLEKYKGFRHKVKLEDFIDSFLITFSYNKTNDNNKKKILIYSLGEHANYFNMSVKYFDKRGDEQKNFKPTQRFENGYGSIVDFNSYAFDRDKNPIISIKLICNNNKYLNRRIEIGYEIIDNKENDIRKIDIMEHVYGMTEKSETCYKIKDKDISELNNNTVILINIFSQALEFNIKDSNNEKVYSLDVFNNYFIRFPNISGDYFCFKHITPKENEDELYGEISYDFQIYLENELKNYQIFIMPLINGKIYTHSLNRGDTMVYRHNYCENYTKNDEKKIYSANMLRIRGNPKLYGYTCNEYPHNCNVDIKKQYLYDVDKINPLNMYYINKRLDAAGNVDINQNGEAVYEQRNQYLTIVSCESEETDPNKGECKYTIEINNERDEIQLIPEIVFATMIINPINYFSIRLTDYESTKYLKLQFTVLIGNAELFIYTDNLYQSHGLKRKWYSNVKFGDGNYAGVFGVTMDGVYIDRYKYRARVNKKWLPEVIGRQDYAGILGYAITDIAILGNVKYRVHVKKDNRWLPWVDGKNYNISDYINGYAGNGSIIDAIEIKEY